MPITEKELPELLEFIGVADVKDVADFKTRFADKWHTADTFFESDAFKSHVGKWNGSLLSKIKGIAKSFGVEVTGKEVDGKEPDQIVEMFAKKLQEMNNEAIETVKSSAKGSKDENYKALEQKYNSAITDFKTIEENNRNLKAEMEKQASEFASKFKEEKLSFRKNNLYSNYKWSKEVDDLRKKGFIATIEEKAKWDLDENDILIPLDAKTGQKFTNPKSHGTFLSAEEFLQREGEAAKVYMSNNDGGKPAPAGGGGWGKAAPAQSGQAPNNNGTQTRELAKGVLG
jgi:hypothetical protein